MWEGRGAEISAMESFYRLASDIGRETLVGRVIMRSVFASFRLMGTTPSCRRHAERATPQKLTSGEKLAVVLIHRTRWFGGVSPDERADFPSFPCVWYTWEMTQNAQMTTFCT